jgi:hypothetical protein
MHSLAHILNSLYLTQMTLNQESNLAAFLRMMGVSICCKELMVNVSSQQQSR